MLRRQNLHAIVATMPRVWGVEGLVRGRTIEHRRFQFVFNSEEAMESVIRRGPWAYAERMLALQRWTPMMDMNMLNFIPLWLQIRGIPLQYMNREVIVHLARAMGQYIQMDYNEELRGRLEFVRVRLNWNVNEPLRFQRNFQFTLGVNTLLHIQYERLRGFCETCGLITHDTGRCLIQNGGPDDGGDNGGNDYEDDHHSEENQNEEVLVPNRGVIIEEINEEAEDQQGGTHGDQDGAMENVDVEIESEDEKEVSIPNESDGDGGDDIFWDGLAKQTMFSDDINSEEMYSITPFSEPHPGYRT